MYGHVLLMWTILVKETICKGPINNASYVHISIMA